jgi:predicted nucleic acid-binding protein
VIILDTNVLSAVMRGDPDPAVVAWLDARPAESFWLTAVTILEIRFGLELLSAGRKRRELEKAFATALEQTFEARVLPFDQAAAEAAGRLAARRREAGRPVEVRDVQIAGIALSRKATLATRNVRHFAGVGIPLADPWA